MWWSRRNTTRLSAGVELYPGYYRSKFAEKSEVKGGEEQHRGKLA